MGNRKKREIEYDGKTYETIAELAQYKGKDTKLIYNRLRKGWDLKQSVESGNTLCTSISYNGQKYRSIKEMADKLNIPYGVLRSRLQKGQTPDEAVNTPIKRGSPVRPVIYMGTTYRSLSALARQLDISPASIRNQMFNCGLSLEEAVAHCMEHHRGVSLFGKKFNSLKELAEYYEIDLLMLYVYLRNGITLEETVTKMKAREPFIYAGKSYRTITDLCQAYGVQVETFHIMIQKGATIDQALRTKREPSTHGKGLYYNGKFYVSCLDLCDEYKINVKLVRSAVQKMPELQNLGKAAFVKAFELFLEVKTRANIPMHVMMNRVPGCVYQGVIYNTQALFFKEIGLSTSKVSAYKQVHGARDTTQALIDMQKHTKPAYKKGDDCISLKDLLQKKLHNSEIIQYKKCRVLAYPQLTGMDFARDFVDTKKIYNELKDKI